MGWVKIFNYYLICKISIIPNNLEKNKKTEKLLLEPVCSSMTKIGFRFYADSESEIRFSKNLKNTIFVPLFCSKFKKKNFSNSAPSN